MRKLTRYICEKCRAEYFNEEDAIACESEHIAPLELDMKHIHYRNRLDYSNFKYPLRLRVKMENGDVVLYYLERPEYEAAKD